MWIELVAELVSYIFPRSTSYECICRKSGPYNVMLTFEEYTKKSSTSRNVVPRLLQKWQKNSLKNTTKPRTPDSKVVETMISRWRLLEINSVKPVSIKSRNKHL